MDNFDGVDSLGHPPRLVISSRGSEAEYSLTGDVPYEKEEAEFEEFSIVLAWVVSVTENLVKEVHHHQLL